MSITCPECGGKGKKKVGFFRSRVCSRCHGKRYIPDPAIVDDDTSSLALQSGIVRDVSDNTPHEAPVQGHGGTFGGAGADGHWGSSHSHHSHHHSDSGSHSSHSDGGHHSSSSDGGGSSGGSDGGGGGGGGD